jgi:hypothetical protein
MHQGRFGRGAGPENRTRVPNPLSNHVTEAHIHCYKQTIQTRRFL